MDQLVRDEVWTRLDPLAGRLSRRDRWRLRLSAALALAAALGAGALWWSGLIVPRLGWPASSGWSSSARPGSITMDLLIVNHGWTSAEIVGAGRSGPGLRLADVSGTLPITLAPGQSVSLRLRYRVTGCAAVPATPWPVPVQVTRPWGTVTVFIQLPTMDPPGTPSGMRTFTGSDPYAVPWQRALADESCAAGGAVPGG